MKQLWICAAVLCLGCGGAVIEPGHRGLLFDPKAGGVHQDILPPGYHKLDSCFLRWVCPRVDDYDITFQTHKEEIQSVSSEGLVMNVRVAIIYRPIVAELYELNTEIGPNYYEEVVGPEFWSTTRGVLARHSYLELVGQNEKVENEVEENVRRRIKGKHVEIASVTIEGIAYAQEIASAVQMKLIGEQEAARHKALLEAEAKRKKLEIEVQGEQARLRADASVQQKKDERVIAQEQAAIDKVKTEAEAAQRITKARAEAEETKLLAKAEAERRRAEATTLTPLMVQMHAYDALAKLGGSGTTIMMGDFSRVPAFLFPQFAYGGGYSIGGAGRSGPNTVK
jgi:regulator of protease activity HflC (stomatin/prohibitin superfamily)